MSPQELVIANLSQRASLYGASLVASEFDDSAIVVWGPRGCTSQIVEAMSVQRQQFDYYHFALTESDLVTNGPAVLRARLKPFVDGWNGEGALFVFLGESTQLMHEDVEGNLGAMAPPGFPLVYVETGLTGDHYWGINEALLRVAQRLCKPTTAPRAYPARRVCLIPEVGVGPSWRGDANEAARLLRALGLEVNVFVDRSTLAGVAGAVSASDATVLLGPRVGLKAARYLEERLGIPYHVPQAAPLGLKGTERWLRGVAERLGVESARVDALVNAESERFFVWTRPGLREESYNMKVAVLRASRAVVCDEATRAAEWARALVEELGVVSCLAFALGTKGPTPEARPALPVGVEWLDDAATLAQRCAEPSTALILGSDWLEELPGSDRPLPLLCTSHPVLRHVSLVSRPYAGFEGFRNLLDDALSRVRL